LTGRNNGEAHCCQLVFLLGLPVLLLRDQKMTFKPN
jgi:hypothetical protein